MKENNTIYICVKAAHIFGRPLILFLALFFLSFYEVSANKTVNKPTIDSIINLENPDIKLLQNAILQSLNNFRSKNKLEKLLWSDTLYKSSQFHLDNMNTKKFFDHTNPSDKNYPDLKKRVIKFSGHYQCLSENLIQYFPFKFKGKIIEYNIKKVKSRYQYLNPKTLKPLEILTYNQLANQIVANWEASPPHRENMLNTKYTKIGIAISFPKYFQTPDISPVTVVSNFGGYN